MKFNYKLQRLCGAYYGHPNATDSFGSGGKGSGSNLIYTSDGNVLISAISNRVQVLDLQTHIVRTLPIEARSNIGCLALSPDDTLLLVVDVQNYAMLINFSRGVALHRFKFKRKVRHAAFSPCGNYIAVTHGKHVQVWYAPNHLRKEFSPLVLHRTYTGQSNDVTRIEWSSDSSVLLATSRDCTARMWTVHTTRNFEPVTLSGHKTMLIGAFFTYDSEQKRIESCYTISADGALVTWKANYDDSDNVPTEDIDMVPNEFEVQVDESLDFFSGGGSSSQIKLSTSLQDDGRSKSQAHQLVLATWSVQNRHYFRQEGADAVATSYCPRSQLLAIGFSSGIFGIYEMPSVSNIHTLSVGSNQLIRSCVLNKTGEWLALGCPSAQQLLVWEWRSESYILKQRGHAYGMKCMAYSPDGVVVCTGGEDGKIKLWNATSGFCYVTLEQSHQAPVTAVCFANASVVLSTSLDGTVRAHDMHRYRTFKTFTTPKPVQFLSLAVDPSGEIVVAGSMDPFHIYAWNLQTGKLLDVLTGHQGPVCDLAFQSSGGILASASWDGTVKTWDLYKGNIPSETLQHSTDVVCVACRPDGKEICTGTIGGLLSFWDVENGKLKFEIDGRRDIAGGRKMNDHMTADNNASSRYFTSVCYSADGSCILAGGNSKYVCIYEVSQQMLLKKFQVTFNRSLDGVLDQVCIDIHSFLRQQQYPNIETL
jgi:periodic tryptophan protein 2